MWHGVHAMGQKTGVAGPRVSRCDGRPATDAGRKSAIVANEGIAPTPPRIPLHRPRPRPAGRVAIKPLSPTWYSMIGVGQRLTSWRWVASGAAFTAAASVAAFVSPPAYSSPISSNRVLGDGRHRIGLCGWPLKGARAANDPRVATPRDLFGWVRKCGYEGVELTTEDFKSMYFEPETPSTVVIRDIRAAAAAAGMARVSSGGLYHVTDGGPSPYGNSGRPVLDFHSLGFEADVRRMLEDDMKLDCEYANFQIHLSPRYLNAGGAHRADEAYLSLCASRIEMLQRICHSLGLNCYIETHIERITEDPEAFVKIMDRARYFEINGDLSHYAYRAITQGRSLPRIMSRVNHLHCRMARPHGDLSADILVCNFCGESVMRTSIVVMNTHANFAAALEGVAIGYGGRLEGRWTDKAGV